MNASVIAAGAVVAIVVVVAGRLRRRLPPRVPLPRSVAAQSPHAGPPRRARVTAAGLIGAGAIASIGPVLTVLLAAAAFGFMRVRRRRVTAACQRAVEAAMPDATELLVACLHAGRSPTQAVVELGRLAPEPIRPAFGAVGQRLQRGAGLADALGELVVACGRCALPLVTAMSAAVRDGLPLTPVLDRLGDEANASRRRQGEAAARRLPVRLSFPLVVCTLPSFVLLSVAPAVLGAVSSLRGSPL